MIVPVFLVFPLLSSALPMPRRFEDIYYPLAKYRESSLVDLLSETARELRKSLLAIEPELPMDRRRATRILLRQLDEREEELKEKVSVLCSVIRFFVVHDLPLSFLSLFVVLGRESFASFWFDHRHAPFFHHSLSCIGRNRRPVAGFREFRSLGMDSVGTHALRSMSCLLLHRRMPPENNRSDLPVRCI